MRCCTTSASPSPRSTAPARPRGAPPTAASPATNPPMGTFPCKGGGLNDYVYVFTSRANPEHWTRLLKVIGREDLIGDARYDTPRRAPNARTRSTTMISEWTKQHTKHEAMEIIGAAGVPAGAVLDTMELYNDPTFEQRGIMPDHRASDERHVQDGRPGRCGSTAGRRR